MVQAGSATSGQPGEQLEIPGFRVALANFQGPFDLLLQLIGQRKLDITDVALAEVTDEFIEYVRMLGDAAELEEITEFLVVAATLLDLKAARLVPRGDVDDAEDLELLSTRDLLFARLLQYKAYKQVADMFAQWQRGAQLSYPRAVSLEQPFAELLPPVAISQTPQEFAELAAAVFRPRPPDEVATGHVHEVAVSVPEQAGKILDTLKLAGEGTWLSFMELTRSCEVSMQVVGRFLALLELYKALAVDTRQEEPLGELSVVWTGVDVDPAVVAASNWD